MNTFEALAAGDVRQQAASRMQDRIGWATTV
jgi:hypothetical protein